MTKVLARVTRRTHTNRDEEGRLHTHRAGDTVLVTENELKAFKDRLERIEGASEEDVEDAFGLGELGLDELREKADELGIKYTQRWKEARLRSEIAEALTAGSDDDGDT